MDTDADLTAQYRHHANVSDWQVGSPWEHRRVDGSGTVDVVGTVLEAEAPTRLVLTFEDSPNEERANGASVVSFLIDPHAAVLRLTVTHENLPNMGMFNGIRVINIRPHAVVDAASAGSYTKDVFGPPRRGTAPSGQAAGSTPEWTPEPALDLDLRSRWTLVA